MASLWLHLYLSNGSSWTPGSNKKQSSETVQSLVICIWVLFLFWCFSIKPALPLFLMTQNLLMHIHIQYVHKSKWFWYLFGQLTWNCFETLSCIVGCYTTLKPNNHNLNSIFVYFIVLTFSFFFFVIIKQSKNMSSYYLLNHKDIVEPKMQILLSLTSAWLYSADILKNVGNHSVLVIIDFRCLDLKHLSLMNQFSKYIILWPIKMFGTTWGWVNDDNLNNMFILYLFIL